MLLVLLEATVGNVSVYTLVLIILGILAVIGCAVGWKLHQFLAAFVIGFSIWFIIFCVFYFSPKDSDGNIVVHGIKNFDVNKLIQGIILAFTSLSLLMGLVGYIVLHTMAEYNPKEY